MRRFAFMLGVAAFAGIALLGIPRRAMALDHVSALRSGELIVAPPVLRVPPSVGAGEDSRMHADVIPVLLSRPHLPGEVKSYNNALSRLIAPQDSALIGAYAKLVSSTQLTPDILDAVKQGVSSVSWIKGGNDVSLYKASSNLDDAAMKRIAGASGKDAVVFMKPLVVFSPDFSRVYVIERLKVYAWGPVHSFFMGSDTLHSGYLLMNTRPELEAGGIQGLAASDAAGENAVRARISVWFANHAQRLMQAIKAASQNLTVPLSGYLGGHA